MTYYYFVSLCGHGTGAYIHKNEYENIKQSINASLCHTCTEKCKQSSTRPLVKVFQNKIGFVYYDEYGNVFKIHYFGKFPDQFITDVVSGEEILTRKLEEQENGFR